MNNRTGKVVNGREKLTRSFLVKWLRGQRAMNRFTEAERRAWLQGLTVEQARQVFDELNQMGDSWKEHGGDLKTLDRRRVESKLEARRLFMKIERNNSRRH